MIIDYVYQNLYDKLYDVIILLLLLHLLLSSIILILLLVWWIIKRSPSEDSCDPLNTNCACQNQHCQLILYKYVHKTWLRVVLNKYTAKIFNHPKFMGMNICTICATNMSLTRLYGIFRMWGCLLNMPSRNARIVITPTNPQ